MLFIKGLIVGIGKIIPGVSGALLAINLGVYERLIKAVTNFFDDYKNNFKFILIFGLGMIISIVFGSKIIIYLFNNYKFITLSFFLGLIIGGTYIFSKEIRYNIKNIIIILIMLIIFLLLCLFPINFKLTNFLIIYFISGYIEIFASIIPGISATALLMMLGIYDKVLLMIANSFDISYVLDNINIYIIYILGMFISFIINIYLIRYLFSKYRNCTYTLILCLSVISIILLIINILNINYNYIELCIGIIFLFSGILIAKKLS